MHFDMPLEELQAYRPVREEPADFDAFWAETLTEARRFPLEARFEPISTHLKFVEVFDVTFKGYGGQAVKGWFLLPRQRSSPLPCLVEYIGYGGGRGHPFEWLLWSNVGYAHFIMDVRGQGSSWRHGNTPDLEPEGSNPHYPGSMTRGILNPRTYYYRRLFTDAVRAVEAARSHPAVDPERAGALGGSQGGGITLAVAGLVPDLAVAMPDVPFLCHFRRATGIVDTYPYAEITAYLKVHRDQVDIVFHTLSYFDGMNFAARAKAPALFSVGLMDDICPPSTVFAAYNHYAGPKEIRIWSYNRHEGGQSFQDAERMHFLANLWR